MMTQTRYPHPAEVAALYQLIFPLYPDQKVVVLETANEGVLTIRLQYENGLIDDIQDMTIDTKNKAISGFWRGHLLEYFGGKWLDINSGIEIPRPVVDGIWVERLHAALFGDY